MCQSFLNRLRLRGTGLIFAALVAVVTAAGPARAQNPSVGSVDCDQVRTNAQQTVADPDGDVTGPGGACPNPVNYGFDYGNTAIWLDPVSGNLYFCVNLNGNVGDSDQDGGYNTKSSVCGGHPSCVTQESDVFGNIFAAETEKITWAIDRNCDGIDDLVFTLTGSNQMRADSAKVTIDALPGHASHANDILGGRGVAWNGTPIQMNADVSCVADRNGAVLLCIKDWKKYFTDNGLVNGNIVNGASPTLFKWLVDSGNNADLYNEDRVEGFFDISAPAVDIEKSANPSTLCEIGASTTFTVTVTNTGNVALTGATVTDQLPAGLTYVNGSANVPPTSVVGGLITWDGGLSLQPGAILTFTFNATKNAQCQGTVTDTARVVATFNPECYPANKILPTELSAEATFDVTCIEPCVSIDVPPTTDNCVGQTVQLPLVVTNCSGISENIVVNCSVGGVPQVPVTFNSVGPGETRNLDVPVNCTVPGPVSVTCSATATAVGFPNCQTEANDSGIVQCHESCAQVDVPASTDVCVGNTAQIPVTVTNCGTEAENFVITCLVNGVPQPPVNFNDVEAAGIRNFNIAVTCNDPGAVTVSCSVAASVVSAPACTSEASDQGTVNCLQACTTINVPDNTNLCVGQTVQIPVSVTNCSDRVEDLLISCLVNGVPQAPVSFAGVEAGGNRNFNVTVNGVVPGDVPISCTVDATFSSAPACTASATDGGTAHVQQACATVSVPPSTTTCVGTPVNVPVTVANCGTLAEDFTLNCSVDGVPRAPITGTLAAGAQQTFNLEVSCTDPGSRAIVCTLNANVTGAPECSTSVGDEGTVICSQACATIDVPALTEVCVGNTAQIPVSVTNCGTEAENFSITCLVNGVPQAPVTFDNVESSGVRNFNVAVTCTDPGSVTVSCTVNASVVAAPECTTQQSDTGTVNCLQACANITVPDNTNTCVNQTVLVPVTVGNCSNRVEDLAITCLVNGVPQPPVNFANVEAGGNRNFNVTVNSDQVGDVAISCTVNATFSDAPSCTTSASDGGTVHVQQACATVDVPANTTTCVGTPVTIPVTVVNCGTLAEDFTLNCSVDGVPRAPITGTIQPGTHVFNLDVECSGPGTRTIACTLAVSVVGFPDCVANTNDSGTVTCQQACVTVDVPPTTTTCVGTPVNIPVTVANCSTFGEDFTLNCSVDGVPRAPITGTLAAGGQQTFNLDVECAGPGTRNIVCSVAANVTGSPACSTSASDQGTVTCQQACATIVLTDNLSTCVGTPVNVPATITNCGQFAEDFSVVSIVNGVPRPPVTFSNVPAGETRNFNIEVACAGPGTASVSATVTANVTGAPACSTSSGDETTVSCLQACATIDVTNNTNSCVGQTVQVPVTVTNCGLSTENLSITTLVKGVPQAPVTFSNVPAGESRNFNVSVTCTQAEVVPISSTVTASVASAPACSTQTTDTGTVTCTEACVGIVANTPSQSICPGGTAQVPYTVTNCATGAENISVVCTVDGVAGAPIQFAGVPAGETRTFNVTVPCTGPGNHTVSCTATATLVGNELCTDDATANATVTCLNPNVDIVKSTSQSETDSCSTVRIVVRNTGNSILDPVTIHDCFPTGLTFDQSQTLGGNCGTSVDHVSSAPGGFTCVYFTPITLAPAASCTLTYKLCCNSLDGIARVDTATVVAYCQGTSDIPGAGISKSDTSLTVCPTPPVELCWMTGGGCLNDTGKGGHKMHTFGGNVGPPPSSSWEHVVRDGNKILFNFHSWEAQVDSCWHDGGPGPCHPETDNNNIVWSGPGLYSDGNGKRNVPCTFVAHVIDRGEPGSHDGPCGKKDYYEITVYNLDKTVAFHAGDFLTCGNLQLHKSTGRQAAETLRSLGAGGRGEWTTGMDDMGMDPIVPGILETRAFPNPVRQSVTTIYYNIPEGMGESQVDILIFDVAGRVVRHLVSETRGPGQFMADWNLTDDSGTQVSSGIFFYRLSVGAETITQKMMVVRK